MLREKPHETSCVLCKMAGITTLDTTMWMHSPESANCHVVCKRCGEFDITVGTLELLQELDAFHLISGVTREWSDGGRKDGRVSEDNVRTLINLSPKTLKEKRRRLLRRIASKAAGIEDEVKIDTINDIPLGYVRSKPDLISIMRMLQEEQTARWGTNQGDVIGLTLTLKGWDVVDSLDRPTLSSQKAFVAMWFSDEVKSAYSEGIEPAIRKCGYDAIRIDLKEHADSVIDQIVAEIKESRFVVADFTAHRNGVYYEAGFARGLGLDVIWCCRQDHLKDLHFDIRGFNVIVWSKPEELRAKLDARIRAVVGRGPLYEEGDLSGQG